MKGFSRAQEVSHGHDGRPRALIDARLSGSRTWHPHMRSHSRAAPNPGVRSCAGRTERNDAMATILDSLRNAMTPDLLARASSLLGETEGGISRALGAASSAILGAMMNKSGDAGTMRQVTDLLGERGIDATVARNPLSLLTGSGLAKSPTTDLGARLLSTLFGS